MNCCEAKDFGHGGVYLILDEFVLSLEIQKWDLHWFLVVGFFCCWSVWRRLELEVVV
jgi:hypothetical protein